MSIANFICPALQEGLLDQICWVVPDGSWATPRSRADLLSHLREIQTTYPNCSSEISVQPTSASMVVYGKALTICSLRSIPRLEESVLLDLDVDFLIIPKVSYGPSEAHGAIPWCWPDELIRCLRNAEITSDCVTIAYSVEGGYCPLKWKYLGDELRIRLCNPLGVNPPLLEAFDRMREAALAWKRQDWDITVAQYRKCAALWPDSAAPLYSLAQALLHQGRIREARRSHLRALAIDPTYATPYNSSGFHHCFARRYKAARRAYRRALSLDPENASAFLGLAQISVHYGQWQEAKRLFQTALRFDPRLVDAHRGLSKVMAAQGRYAEAANCLQKALILSANGCKPLVAPITTVPSEGSCHRRDMNHIIRTWGLGQ